MNSGWICAEWGDLATLQYGKGLRGYEASGKPFRVYGTNGPIGTHDVALSSGPTVVVGRKGAYRGIHYSSAPCYVIDTAFYLTPRVDLDMRWAYYALLTHDINGMDSGSAIPSTSREAFYRLPVLVPPLHEQGAISSILGALDDKIQLNHKLSVTLEAMARALFKSWFVDFDPVPAKAEGRDTNLPSEISAHFPNSLEDSELGEIPKGWRILGLDEIARFLNGLALQKYPPANGRSLPVVKIAQLRAGNTIGADLTSADIDREYVVSDGDVLFSWSGSLECVLWTGDTGALNQHLFKVTSTSFPKWFYYLWIHEHLKDFRHIAEGKATTMGHIQRHHLSQAKALVPSHALLEYANTVFSPLIDRIISLRLESRTLGAILNAFLPRLISGEIRVGVS